MRCTRPLMPPRALPPQVAALLCFGSLMALAVFSVFALVVRINKLLTKERKLRIQQLFTRKSRRAEAMV